MKYETSALILAFLSVATAIPVRQAAPAYRLRGREVPQEHSHNTFLDSVRTSLALNNPDGIVDPVFGLLGNAAAAAGLGKITDPDCLHQATADQAFTNAKAAGDVAGMTGALIYAGLERNTGRVGLASVACTAIKATNPEIAAISQHQDPASAGAAATNKAITLEIAKQIAAIGGDPQEALKSGTFAPGDVNDNTGKGNTCDTADDEPGCIFTLNLLVEDATAAEIDAAVAGSGGATNTEAAATTTAAAVATDAAASSSVCAAPKTVTVTATADAAAVTGTSSCAAQVTQTATVTAGAAATTAAAAAASTSAAAASGSSTNVQKFTGALGGAPPPVNFTEGADRPFEVNGNTFLQQGAATQRSCAIQHNACSDAANSGTLSGGQSQCETQESDCNAANA